MADDAERAAKRQHVAPVGRGRGAPAAPNKPQGRGRGQPASAPGAPGAAPRPAPAKAERRTQNLGRALQSKAARQEAASAARNARSSQGAGRDPAGNAAPLMRGLNTEEEDTFAGTFARDLPSMMYGFGDDEVPLKETVDMVESSLKNKMDEKDIMFVVRKDPAKFARIRELLVAKEMIAEVRKTAKEPAV